MDHFEQRLDTLREEAKRTGTVSGNGVHAAGGPMPLRVPDPSEAKPGYYGLPIIKPPVWK